MNFVKEVDIFKFYEGASPKQITFNAPVLNKQLKQLIQNDINIRNNIELLDRILNSLDIHRPNKVLNRIIQPREQENLDEYINVFRDFGTIKVWK